MTALSVLFAVAAALAFWQASRPAMIAGAVLLYLGFVLDCVDGQLARYTRRFGAFGGWLDTMADRAKEYAAYAGLAAGAERIGLPYAWPLAITAMLLQTVRHMTDTWYGALHDEAAARPARAAAAGWRWVPGSAPASNRVQADTGSRGVLAEADRGLPDRRALGADRGAGRAVQRAGGAGRGGGLGGARVRVHPGVCARCGRSRCASAVLDTVDTSRHRDDGPLVRAVHRAGPACPGRWRSRCVAAGRGAAWWSRC